MAINFWESYERDDDLQSFNVDNITVVTTPAPPHGTWTIRVAVFDEYLLATSATKILHSWLRFDTNLAASRIIEFRNGSTILGSLRRNASNQLELYNGASTLLGNSGNSLVTFNTWYHFQFKMVISASVGIMEVKLDNVLVAQFTGLNTGSTNPDRFRVLSNTGFHYFKDIVVDDANYLGVVKSKPFFPTGQGNYTAFTGTNADVDEAPHDGDTTKLSSTVSGDKESVTFAAHGLASNAVIKAVQLNTICKGASGEQIKIGYRQSSTDSLGSAQNLATSYGLIKRIDEVNPLDGFVYDLSDLVQEAVVESVIP